MAEMAICSKCGSSNITVNRIKGAWGPIARLVEYPGMGEEIACGDCGHTEIDTSNAPTRDQLMRRTWFLSFALLALFLIYLLLNNLWWKRKEIVHQAKWTIPKLVSKDSSFLRSREENPSFCKENASTIRVNWQWVFSKGCPLLRNQ